ncbi:hypothetical protein A3H38_03000 [candidate division WOR-1 bacterium RIFCSPLOWO2_02_FULL_46_20]|uniref:Secreted protein n=2 Tax=Saganbacteria TaxID=1703751 RepID=A0A1F4R8V6_UNCSA|nr:MAG: hypothetical protein A3J44_00755 [candidate division WOR-1 bacterium RIFCSPHIGHO2_02_FULL_45_12]OGC04611.1 MAG: hypothetical protein A3H38_03000 [candidate division WOR-1 bacterium RIFCSPLOWO2_02_FULL_46_20]OGC08860.1 MAG: hypothetical protein A3F86_00240 [candidate division WOR-1 bacterium RIFCSPLOWO2_12_FULL_45_9]
MRLTTVGLICILAATPLLAETPTEQEYVNQLTYKNSKLQLVINKRLIDERKNYGHTDIDTTTYSYEAYSTSNTDISTSSLSQSEVKEITEWYIFKGGVRKLSDLEFLELIGDKDELVRIRDLEFQKAGTRNAGNLIIGTGFLVMLGGAATSAGQTVTTAGALGMILGFFVNAFNRSPDHYIQPDYAQEKIDFYNLSLKKKLELPVDYN